MNSFNPKTSILKYPIFFSRYDLFSANVSDFYAYFTAKNQNFGLSYFCRKLTYINTFSK